MMASLGGMEDERARASAVQDTLTTLDRLFRRQLADYTRSVLLGEVAAAEDIVEETFARARRCLHRYSDVDPTRLRPWLYTIARRLIIDVLRARRARPAKVLIEDGGPVEDGGPFARQHDSTTGPVRPNC